MNYSLFGLRSCQCKLLFCVSQCIEGVVGGADYNQSKVNQWTASIVEQSLTHLVKQGRPFKYIGELGIRHLKSHKTLDVVLTC